MRKLFLLLPMFLLAGCGEGFWERQTSIGGIAVIESPKGKPIDCFVDSAGGGIHCVPHKDY